MVFKTANVVKAEGGVGFGQKGLMMELQSLQEALKVEIQIHQKLVAQMKHDPQNAELKLQLHDLQAKITVLSERQKKVVEQLRRDLLVKQDSAEVRLQPYTQLPLQADVKTTTLVSSQSQNCLPPTHLNTPQNSVSVTPVITTKTLPLMLRAATPTTPIAMLPTPTIAMVTTLTNTPRPSLPNSDTQSSPISLQMTGNQGTEPVRIVPKNTIVVMPKTSVTPAALQPILASTQQPVLLTAKLSSALLPSSGPVHQLHIFNPQPGTTNTQPGTNTTQPCPNNAQSGFNIIQPCPGITMTLSTNITQFNPSSSQHNTQIPSILISAQSNKPHAASPAQANADSLIANTPHTAQNIGPCQDALLTTIAVSTVTPKTSDSGPSACPAPQQSISPSTTAVKHTPAASRTPAPKCQDNPLKLAFMLSLGLVTQDYLDEIQNKRQERKRRTTANPIYSGAVFEPERKKSTVSYMSSANQGCKKRGRPPKPVAPVEQGISPLIPTVLHSACVGPHSPAFSQTFSSHPSPSSPRLSPSTVGDGDIHDDFCVLCRHGGQLLMCDTCSRFYHQDCLAPIFHTVPRRMWICPSCQKQILKTDEALEWPGTLAIVHSYISYKAEREQEKLRLEKWGSDLLQERQELELRAKQLSDSITVCTESRNGVLARQKEMEASIGKLKSLVHLIRSIQLPTVPQFTPRAIDNVNLGFGSTQQPITTLSSDENKCPNRKTSSSFGYIADIGSTSTDLRHTSNPNNNAINTNISSPKIAEDTTDMKNTSTSRCGSAANNSLAHSNTHKQNSMNASSNGRLVLEDGQEESKNQKSINDVNKSSTGEISKNIRDLRATSEPLLPPIMSMPEVVHSLE